MYVKINNGAYRNTPVTGVFPVVRPHNGKFVTVRVNALDDTFKTLIPRINCAPNDYEYCDVDGNATEYKEPAAYESSVDTGEFDYESEFIQNESESHAMSRIRDTFFMLDEVTAACQQGIMRGVVVAGPPGIGKSYGSEKVLEEYNLVNSIAGREPAYEVVKGSASAVHLYIKLYFNRKAGQVLMLDDCDTLLFDEEALNLLKTALDTTDRRVVSYLKESRVLDSEGIPNQFEFNGSVMFLTNLDFERTKNSKIKNHLDAIMSRCHYLDLAINNTRDKILRIKQIVNDGMLNRYDFSPELEQQIVQWISDNAEHLREISLRTTIKLADIVKAMPTRWERVAECTLLKNQARYKRMLNEL